MRPAFAGFFLPSDLRKKNPYISKSMDYKKKLRRLKRLSDQELDKKFEIENEKAFEKIDCLSCANCCKTKGPTFSKKDINRIAKSKNLSPQDFSDKHLKINEDGNYVLNQTPCVFLEADNKCGIYEIRPEACASYPHINTRNISQLFPYFETHVSTCPIIEEVIREVKE